MDAMNITSSVGAFIVVLALILAMAALLKWLQKSKFSAVLGQGKRLQLLEQCYLDPKHKLVLARIDDREIVLALSPGGVKQVDANLSRPTAAQDAPRY